MCVDSCMTWWTWISHLQAKDKHGITPLLAAIWEGHTECVSILLRGGADKNGSAPDGTAYKDAAEKDEIKVLISWIHIYQLWLGSLLIFTLYGVEWVIIRIEQEERFQKGSGWDREWSRDGPGIIVC